MRVVILGGYGNIGRALARKLLVETNARLVLAGKNLVKAQRAADEFNELFGNNRVEAVQADAGDPEGLKKISDEFEDVVLLDVANAALEADVDFLDLQYSPAKFEALRTLSARIQKAGRCFITEAGFHRGLPLAAVRYAARDMERVDKALVGSVLNQKRGLPYANCVDEIIERFIDYRGRVFKEGQWKEWGKIGWASRLMYFGDPFGSQSCYPLDLVEMDMVPRIYLSVREAVFFIAGFNPITDYVLLPVILTLLKLGGKAAVGPAGRLLCWGTRFFAKGPYGVRLKAEVTGVRSGRLLKREVYFSHEDVYDFTAIPVVACLMQWMDKSIRRAGLYLMGAVVDPERLVKDMVRMGVLVYEEE